MVTLMGVEFFAILVSGICFGVVVGFSMTRKRGGDS
jgi:hypothetical protein